MEPEHRDGRLDLGVARVLAGEHVEGLGGLLHPQLTERVVRRDEPSPRVPAERRPDGGDEKGEHQGESRGSHRKSSS